MSNIIHLNEPELKNQLDQLVRETVEDTLNKLLDAEAEGLSIILCSSPLPPVNANEIAPFLGRRWIVAEEFGPSSEFCPSISA